MHGSPTQFLLHACKSHPILAARLQAAPSISCIPGSPTHFPLTVHSIPTSPIVIHTVVMRKGIFCISLFGTLIYKAKRVKIS
jgi:hypothetical protein